jgi:protein TonB
MAPHPLAALPAPVPLPAAPQPPRPLAALPAPIPTPVPPPPRPAAPELPEVRLSLEPALREALAPEPVPVPVPAPLPEPAPARPEPRRPQAFPAPMDLSLGPGVGGTGGQRRIRNLGGFDAALDPSPRDRLSAMARDVASTESTVHVRGAPIEEAWIDRLHEWWNEHASYPEEAARHEQDGTVRIHIRVEHDGHVRLVEVDEPSGSQWLDAGALAVFRDATVPPLPATTTEPSKDLDLTIRYVLIRR